MTYGDDDSILCDIELRGETVSSERPIVCTQYDHYYTLAMCTVSTYQPPTPIDIYTTDICAKYRLSTLYLISCNVTYHIPAYVRSILYRACGIINIIILRVITRYKWRPRIVVLYQPNNFCENDFFPLVIAMPEYQPIAYWSMTHFFMKH